MTPIGEEFDEDEEGNSSYAQSPSTQNDILTSIKKVDSKLNLPASFDGQDELEYKRKTGEYAGTEGFENHLQDPKASAKSVSPRENNPYAVLAGSSASMSIAKPGARNKPMSKIQMRMRAISGDSQDDSQIKASSKILQEKAEDNQFSMITAVKDFNF